MDHTERIEKSLKLAHRKGCFFVSLSADSDELNDWSLEGIAVDDLGALAAEIHEFCASDVDASGTRTNYQLVGYQDTETRVALMRSPRIAYLPSDEYSDSPQDSKAFSKALMQHSISQLRVFSTAVPQMLDSNMRMTRELLEHVRESDKNRLDAAKLLEKARSKEHKREMKRMREAALEEYRGKVIDQALPYLPRVLGGVAKFVGGGDIKALAENSESSSEELDRANAFRAAMLSLKNSERLSIEQALPGFLDRVGEILAEPASEAMLNTLMGVFLSPWNGCAILETLESTLGSERLQQFKEKAGF